jgi:hypothetical protein
MASVITTYGMGHLLLVLNSRTESVQPLSVFTLRIVWFLHMSAVEGIIAAQGTLTCFISVGRSLVVQLCHEMPEPCDHYFFLLVHATLCLSVVLLLNAVVLSVVVLLGDFELRSLAFVRRFRAREISHTSCGSYKKATCNDT